MLARCGAMCALVHSVLHTRLCCAIRHDCALVELLHTVVRVRKTPHPLVPGSQCTQHASQKTGSNLAFLARLSFSWSACCLQKRCLLAVLFMKWRHTQIMNKFYEELAWPNITVQVQELALLILAFMICETPRGPTRSRTLHGCTCTNRAASLSLAFHRG